MIALLGCFWHCRNTTQDKRVQRLQKELSLKNKLNYVETCLLGRIWRITVEQWNS